MSLRVSVLSAAILFWGNPSHAQGVIYVTSLEDKISETGGCSLKEAIFSANLDNNVAIDKYDFFDSTPHMITTECAKGQGDDTIVLPTGATFLLSDVVDDPGNPTGLCKFRDSYRLGRSRQSVSVVIILNQGEKT
jgi:CSLREA domain-containing protein